ncbi:MAG TPA: hypothetical protein VKN76_10615 [Kiloniellaceae bacterium]|nr:hypothetical protein [Kiloniellaceae bacterium]
MRPGFGGIPLEKDATARLLPALLALLVFLAGMALFTVFAMHRIAAQWDKGEAGELTVQLPPANGLGQNDVAAAATAMDRAIEILKATPGVTLVDQLSEAEIDRLLAPWLGTAEASHSLPLPQLIAVSLDPAAPPDVEALAAAIQAAVPDALVEDHRRGLQSLVSLARWLRGLSWAVVALTFIGCMLTVALVTRMGLAAHGRVIELLHLMGAEDSFVARQFQWHAFKAAAVGGPIGLLIALGTVVAIETGLGQVDRALIPELDLTPLNWAFFILLPVLTAAIAVITARIATLRGLGRLP